MYRTKLVLYLTICLLILGGIWGALFLEFRHDEEQTRKAAEVALFNLALTFEEHVSLTVQHIDSLLFELREDYREDPGHFDRQVRFHQEHAYNDLIFQTSVIDPRGILVYSSQGNPCEPINLSDREHFRVHLAPGKDSLFISKPVLGRVSKKWSLQFTRKIVRKDGSFGGVLVLSMDPEYFSGFFRSVEMGKFGTITLVGLDRVVRARSGGPGSGGDGRGSLVPAARAYFNPLLPASGSYEVTSYLDGVRRIFAYRRLQHYPLVVVAAFGRQEVYEPFEARRRSLIFKGIVVSTALVAGFCLIAIFDRKQQRLNARIAASEERYRHLSRSLEERVQEEIEKNNAKQHVIMQQEKLASIGQLAAGVAHEINNPVGFITSNLRMLDGYFSNLVEYVGRLRSLLAPHGSESAEAERAERELDIAYILDDARDSIAESLDGAARVTKIVSDLTVFSRSGTSELAPADVNGCLESALTIVNNQLKYVADLRRDLTPLPPVLCNSQQLTQVFLNLLVNSCQAMEERGLITVRSRCAGKRVSISISDSGGGIRPEHLPRVFEPFFTTKEVGEGTGLGLSIAYDIVQQHGGELQVRSRLGQGTTFCVCLPVGGDESGPGTAGGAEATAKSAAADAVEKTAGGTIASGD